MLGAATLLLTAVPLCTAQIYDLATTSDGRDLYFASAYKLRGAAASLRPPWWARIYRFAGKAWTPAADGGDTGGLSRPFLSGDGRILGWERSFPCVSCFFAGPPSESQFIGLDQAPSKSRALKMCSAQTAGIWRPPAIMSASNQPCRI